MGGVRVRVGVGVMVRVRVRVRVGVYRFWVIWLGGESCPMNHS